MKAQVTASALNLRQPFPKGMILKTLPKGEIVEMAKHGWFEVKTKDGKIGWVWSEFLAPMENTGDVEPIEKAENITEWPRMKIVRKELGVKEMPGAGDNPRIVEYLKSTTLGRPDNENDETAWCSAFVNWVLKQAGVEPRTNSAWARSWLNWGVATDDPIPGTIVVFSRGQNAGHVGFYLDEDGDRIQVLGGNQGDAVTIAWFPKVNLLGYREPTGWMSV
jgi:uncharacterized protein (TIGR02594 family)